MAPVQVPPADPAHHLHLPEGFGISVFARLPPAGEGMFRGPRFMAFGPDGHLYVSLGFDNRVVMLPERDGRADRVVTVSDQLNAPQGLAFVNGKLLVANQDGVVMLEQRDGQWPASRVIPVISGLPAGGHSMKSLKLGPDGFLYLNVGSSCNVCAETDPLRATMLRYTVDGRPAGALPSLGRHPTSSVWATGLRNSQGFAWNPATGAMFATNDGADMRSDRNNEAASDDLPPEHLNRIEPGRQYGWPYCWGSRISDPIFAGTEEFCQGMMPPAITFPAHTTPLGIGFLATSRFPAEYRSDALVALHGSWNRQQPAGYKVVRVHFEQGEPVAVSDFVTGWLEDGRAWGRPTDIVVGPDGAAYVSDDRAGMIYRITYRKE
ncbi:soluble aldose sugar dehydrogenase YliI precursor [mine drainage metagenome]|uniref:Soluble aldose sugar dehydrogenase YliI n=1 Tax=mine drainage metagenome TaxID=410659 RepID=A0A1J5QFL4_9ZZZZ